MRIAGLTHPKTKKLARKLAVNLPQAIGHLELLWNFVAAQTPRGDIGRWDNGVIADEALWDGDPDAFVNALAECGWLDADDEHRLIVHDWVDHMPSWVRAKLKKSDESVIVANTKEPTREPTKEASAAPTTRVGKGSEGKGSEKKPARKARGILVDDFLSECETASVLPIPADDPIFAYAEKAGIPVEFVELAWREFLQRYREAGKRQVGITGWRETFRKCVRGNWYKLWWANPDGEYALTTTGVQAKKVHA